MRVAATPRAVPAGDDAAVALLANLGRRWRLLESGASSGVRNMATDAALLAHARRSGEATLRVYTWSRRTLSFGRHERARGLYDPARLAACDVDVVRRPTGGRALLHHRELTYSVTAPSDRSSLGESYRAINALLCTALARLDVAVTAAPRATRPLRPEGAACFAEPSVGELVWRGAKLVGSAQVREEGALLQHGSILLEDDQPLIAELRMPSTGERGDRTIVRPAATLAMARGRATTPSEVATALRAALTELVGHGTEFLAFDDASLQGDLARLEGAFGSEAWTWRR